MDYQDITATTVSLSITSTSASVDMVLSTDPPTGPMATQPRSRPPSIQSAEQALPPSHQARHVPSSASLAFPRPEVIPELMESNSTVPTSRTWTPSSGGSELLSDGSEEQDQSLFVKKYNRLASKNGVRPLVVGDFDTHLRKRSGSSSPEKKSWLSRIFRGSSNQSTPKKAAPVPRTHKRSTSDLGSFMRSTADAPRIIDVHDLVRLTGSSLLYLPPGFSPCPLVLPTCIRATAHYLAQNPDLRGVFRVPGSFKNVNALCDYYCDASGSDPYISSTTYLPTLPAFITHHVHDVASTFKRILSGLPRGVLGSISLFDAFLAIYSELQDQPEAPAHKLTKTRARLIALAIQTIDSRLQRDLICAVFGLLNLIGRATELSPTKDAEGRPLPPSQLMSYQALGVIFGPLLVGPGNLDDYDIKKSSPTSGLHLVPTPPKKRRDRQKAKEHKDGTSEMPDLGKINVSIVVAEMVISNWQDVVRQMVSLAAHPDQETAPVQETHDDCRSSISESFVVNHTMDSGVEKMRDLPSSDQNLVFAAVSLRRTRSAGSRLSRQGSAKGPSTQPSLRRMTPTLEERHQENRPSGTVLLPITTASDVVGQALNSTRKVTPPSKPLC
ncbi:hypothetical protein GGI35DRAFT_181769 [Trichoderma velutinum]